MTVSQLSSVDRTSSAEIYWQRAVAESKQFLVPAVLHLDLGFPLVTERDLGLTLQAMARTPGDTFIADSLRAFSGRTKQPGIETLILRNPPPDRNFESWFYTVFPRGNVGLVLNRCERWNGELGGRVAAFLKPLERAFSDKIFEHELSFFIGDYSETPLGIHIDAEVDAFHYVLGPGARRMYTWTPEVYEAVRRPRSITDELMASPDTRVYHIEPHRTFVLPAKRLYHVGVNDGFTVSFAVAIFARSTEEYSRSVGSRIGIVVGDHQWAPPQPVDSTATEYAVNGQISELDRAFLRTRSNAGLANPPIAEHRPVRLGEMVRISLTHPFPIVWVRFDDHIEIFVRGKSLSIPNRTWVPAVLRRLNEGAPTTLAMLRDIAGVPHAGTIAKLVSRLLQDGALGLHTRDGELLATV